MLLRGVFVPAELTCRMSLAMAVEVAKSLTFPTLCRRGRGIQLLDSDTDARDVDSLADGSTCLFRGCESYYQ
jgi:hypothetical protein